MDAISNNLSSLMQVNQNNFAGGINHIVNDMTSGYGVIGNDAAFSFAPNMTNKFETFDAMATNITMFQEILSSAGNNISAMKDQGESIKALVAQAQQEGISDELLDSIQKEVDSRLAAIQQIRDNAQFDGVKLFDKPISMEIPQWQDVLGLSKDKDTAEQEITELVASFTVDMSMNAEADNSKFNMGASATINIGYTDDGSLQITVDATMDFDLSGLSNEGVGSENAMDIINQFLALLTGKQNDLFNANNMFNGFLAKGTASIMGDGFAINATNDINIESESSQAIKGQIVQHASITLDSTANQSPSIAINLL